MTSSSATSPTSPSTPSPTPSKLGRWGAWMRRFSSRRWFLPAAGGVTSADFFMPILPTQTLLIASTLLQPRRWREVALWFVVGGVLGGTTLAAVVGAWGPDLANHMFGSAMQGENWLRVQTLIQNHGAWALLALTTFPWPMRSGVAICALAGVPLLQIAFAIVGGRLVAFGSLAFLVSRSPAWLRRIRYFARLQEEVYQLATQRQSDAVQRARTATLIPTILIASWLASTAPTLSAANLTGDALLNDERRFTVVQTEPTPGEVLRIYSNTEGSAIIQESVTFATDKTNGVLNSRFEDTTTGITLTISTNGSSRTLVFEKANAATETRTEQANEPLLTATAVPAWILAHWDELLSGERKTVRFPITKAGKTLRVRLSLKLDTNGGAVATLRPTNPLFGILADSLVLTFDSNRRLTKQSGLIEPLAGPLGKPSLQSGVITWRP